MKQRLFEVTTEIKWLMEIQQFCENAKNRTQTLWITPQSHSSRHSALQLYVSDTEIKYSHLLSNKIYLIFLQN